MENTLNDFNSLVDYQKTQSFARLTPKFFDTPQIVNKNCTRAFSVEYSLCILHPRHPSVPLFSFDELLMILRKDTHGPQNFD